jgi:hypothetical protein
MRQPGGPEQYAGIYRVGKKAAGRLLDGVTHDQFPEPALEGAELAHIRSI